MSRWSVKEGDVVATRRGAFGGGYSLSFQRDKDGNLELKKKLVMPDKT